MLCKTLPAPFDVLKFDIFTRQTGFFFFCGSGRALEFYKNTLTDSPQFSLPIVVRSVAFFARPTQLNLIIACVSGAGLFFSAMEEISPLRVPS